jgi:hypothetical protein
MKTFTKYFLIILTGVILGYSWAYHHYMPKINAYQACLATYQEYFLQKDQEIPFISGTPSKVGRKAITTGTN